MIGCPYKTIEHPLHRYAITLRQLHHYNPFIRDTTISGDSLPKQVDSPNPLGCAHFKFTFKHVYKLIFTWFERLNSMFLHISMNLHGLSVRFHLHGLAYLPGELGLHIGNTHVLTILCG